MKRRTPPRPRRDTASPRIRARALQARANRLLDEAQGVLVAMMTFAKDEGSERLYRHAADAEALVEKARRAVYRAL